ncbi:FAD:protein FMN transferase [Maribacter chungangensis]|uniref:FAD:protein FMN transferase n=1 Tax=Maribacter chungangensis TaxID=1069117 RepID=UPI0036D2B70D
MNGLAFGTTYRIEYYDFKDTIKIEEGIASVIDSINNSLSTYLPESEISKINRGNSNIVTDILFQDVFKLSKEIHKKSNGYFDPTVGILRNAYGFGDTKPIKLITDLKLDSMMNYVGFDKVRLLPNGKVYKTNKAIYLDFNSIAKGYAVDRIVSYIKSKGIKNLRVEVGGEIRTHGKHLFYDMNWTVGIEGIESQINNRTSVARIELINKSIAGSGNYRKYRVDSLTNKKYVHTINPLNGKAEQGDVLSAFVIAETCAIADGYATTFMAMGIDNSKKMIPSLENIEAYLVYLDSLGQTKTYITAGFKKLIIE